MSRKSVQRFGDNELRKNKDLKATSLALATSISSPLTIRLTLIGDDVIITVAEPFDPG
ncbi:hypothetical protein [Rhizobium sp. Root1203]|uniref:hypothetical protein n=1 Tax=Rhizobium sp. Root1203 TaxID=1736427 RepID=UPI0012E3EC82|nr:hypothetical protein [Rhizobium sp. Root1203]